MIRGATRRSRHLATAVMCLVLLDALVIGTILMTGGLDAPVGPIRSMRGVYNPLQVLWVLLALWAWLRFRPSLHACARGSRAPTLAGTSLAVTALLFLVVAAPLVWKGAALVLRGEYVSYQYSWRSSPGGVDLATVLLGNPFHPWWGDAVQRLDAALAIDAIETTAWFGIAPMLLAAWALRQRGRSLLARQWAVIGVLFFVWSLGPHLMAFGSNTGLILPHAFLRYVPIVSNARIPGRAVVVAYLALAVLAALAAAEWRRTSGRRGVVVVAIAIAVIADYLPAPFPLVAMDRPAVYETLRDDPAAGAVVELPLGIRDGFSERGLFDDRVLFYQTIHGRPIVGGFVARLPRAATIAYQDDPLLAALLNLSERQGPRAGIPLPDRQLAMERLHQHGIAFVVLNRSTASPALMDYVQQILPLTSVAEDGFLTLYQVMPTAPAVGR